MSAGTTSLGRTYKYSFRNLLSNGYYYVQETMALGWTYMYNSRNNL